MSVVRVEPRNMSENGYLVLVKACLDHVEACTRMGMALKPKHHLFTHLTFDAKTKGNPRYYWTYLDESLNRLITIIASGAHRMTFERRIFAKFRLYAARSDIRNAMHALAWY